MRGTVRYGPRDVRLEERPDPTAVEPTDAIIKLSAGCVCGSDLWPYVGSLFASDNTCAICAAGYQTSYVRRQPGAPTGAQAEYARIPLADVAATRYSGPLMITVLSVLFLGERVEPRR